MQPLPTADLRSNLGTWVVTPQQVPMVAAVMVDVLPAEQFDPDFRGQSLETIYFDSPDYDLPKARIAKRRYITLRLRCYGDDGAYAISAKTESEKWRREIDSATAHQLLADPDQLPGLLPAHLRARLTELGVATIAAVVTVRCHRYAVEDDQGRLTLDVGVGTARRACAKRRGRHASDLSAVAQRLRPAGPTPRPAPRDHVHPRGADLVRESPIA